MHIKEVKIKPYKIAWYLRQTRIRIYIVIYLVNPQNVLRNSIRLKEMFTSIEPTSNTKLQVKLRHLHKAVSCNTWNSSMSVNLPQKLLHSDFGVTDNSQINDNMFWSYQLKQRTFQGQEVGLLLVFVSYLMKKRNCSSLLMRDRHPSRSHSDRTECCPEQVWKWEKTKTRMDD